MVLRCIIALKFHWYAYNKRATKPRAIFHLQRTIPVAIKIKNESEAVVQQTKKMRILAKTAYGQANTDLNVTKQVVKDSGKKKDQYEDDQAEYAAKVSSLKNQTEDYNALIAKYKEEEAKKDTEEEFYRKKKDVVNKCVLVEKPVFKEVCKSVFFGLVEDCDVVVRNSTVQDCKVQFEEKLLKMRENQLKRLAKERNQLRDKKLEIEERKLQVQKEQAQQFADLQKIGNKLARLTKLENVQKNQLLLARTSLDLAMKAMIIVQTQLKRMVAFWDNVAKHTSDILREANDKTTDDDVDWIKERIMTSGFSWLALGKVLRIAAYELRSTAASVDDAFMDFPTSDEVAGVITGEARQILDATIELSKKYEQRIKEQEDKIFQLKCKKNNKENTSDSGDEFGEEVDDPDDPEGDEDVDDGLDKIKFD